MKIFNSLLGIFTLILCTFFSQSIFSQNGKLVFHIPYWETEYQKEVQISEATINQLDNIETYISEESQKIRAQQLFWEEEDEMMHELLNNKIVLQKALLAPEQLAFTQHYLNQKQIAIATLEDRAADSELVEDDTSIASTTDWTETVENAILAIQDYYLPEMAVIRAKLEESISEEDKILLRELRKKNNEFIQKDLEGYTYEKAIFPTQEIAAQAFTKMMLKNLVSEIAVYSFLHSTPENYYAAKELAVKYDGIIDELRKEILLMTYSIIEKLMPNTPLAHEMPSLEMFMSQYQLTPDFVEVESNFLLLLLESDESSSVVSNRGLHTLSVFPIPAYDMQNVQFELINDGKVTIDVIASNGQLLKEIFSGNLNAGMHRQEVNVQSIRQNIFFYRVTSEAGVSIVKSIKVH